MSFDASIVIPAFNRADLTAQCLRALITNTPGLSYEVIIVDNASTDATPQLCAGLGGDAVVIRNPENYGFARACNQGADAARSEPEVPEEFLSLHEAVSKGLARVEEGGDVVWFWIGTHADYDRLVG